MPGNKTKKEVEETKAKDEAASSSSKEYGILDLWSLKNLIFDDFKELSLRAQPLARNWAPQLEPIKKLITYLTDQVEKMADKKHGDPTWKNFSTEALSLIAKLDPIMHELSKEKLNYSQSLGKVHQLLEHLPKLLIQLDNLKLHDRVAVMLDLDEELKHDFPDLVLKQLEKYIPQYKKVKDELEEQFNGFLLLGNDIEKELFLDNFKELSVVEKMGILAAMEEFNKNMEKFVLTMNRISIQLGIKEGYLLSRAVFENKVSSTKLSINDLCGKFTALYQLAINTTNAPKPDKESLFPYQEKIILQEMEILKEYLAKKDLKEAKEKDTKNAISKIVLKLEKAINLAKMSIEEKDNPKDNAKLKTLIENYLNTFQALLLVHGDENPENIHEKTIKQWKKVNPKFALPDDLNSYVESILNELKTSKEILELKSDKNIEYAEGRLKISEDKRSIAKITALVSEAIYQSEPESNEQNQLKQFLHIFQTKTNVDVELVMIYLIDEIIAECKIANPSFKLDLAIDAKIRDVVNEMKKKFLASAALKAEAEAKEAKEAKSEAKPVVISGHTKLSRMKKIAADIYGHVKDTKVIIDTHSRDNRSSNIILLIKKELGKLAPVEVKAIHLQLFLTHFQSLLADSKKDMNKIINEAMVRSRHADSSFSLDNRIVKEVLDRHNFSAVSKLENALEYINGQLQVMLDSDIHAKYILGKERKHKFHGNNWVKATGETLREVARTLEKYRELSAFLSSENMESMSGISPKDQLLLAAEKFNEMAKVTKDLVKCFVALEKDPYVKQLLSIAGMRQMLFPSRSELAAQLNSDVDNELDDYDVINEAEAAEAKNATAVVQSTDALEKVFNTISAIYKKSAMKYLDPEDQRVDETESSVQGVQQLIYEYRAFKQKNNSNKINVDSLQIFGFLLNHTKGLFQLLRDLSQTFDSLHSVSKKEFSVLIEQLNEGLCELILLFNRVEIEFNLKQDYFTKSTLAGLLSSELQTALRIQELPTQLQQSSLEDSINLIYQKLESIGYTFKKKFPFTEKIIEQQTKLLAKAPNQSLKKEYLRQSLFASKKEQNEQSKTQSNTRKQRVNQIEKDRINTLIDDTIATLSKELNATNTIQINLLKKLKLKTKSFGFVQQLNKIAGNATDRANMYLLYRGHTKKLMTALTESSLKRKDLLNEVDLNINKLTKKRAQSYLDFLGYRRKKLENTIEAFQQLKQFLSHAGTKVTDFSLEQPNSYKLLVAHDRKLLEKLLKQSEQSYFLKDEKLIAGDVLPTLDSKFDFNKSQTQSALVADRINELQSSWSITSIPSRKIKLLQALTEHLQSHSLTRSLEKIKKDKKFKNDFYLLHEGRTGKLMQKLTQLDLNKKDIINEIDLEINRLQNQRSASFYFTDKSSKLHIENRIRACQVLKGYFEKSNLTVAEALTTLPANYRHLLKRYESGLLTKLDNWEKTNLELNNNARVLRRV